MLAEVLYRNFESQGGRFTLAARRGPEGGTITLQGEIDWSTHRGHAVVSGGTGDHPVTEVWWDDETVAEYRPSLDAVVGPPSPAPRILVRGPDRVHRRLDQLLAVVTGLAAEQPENSQLILQRPGSVFVRHDRLRNTDVVVLRFGERNSYWIDRSTGSMMRFEASDESGNYPVVVDLVEVGPRTVELPSGIEQADFDAVAEDEPALSMSP